jgi:ribosomal protein S18 acetylase RimI-like enzyme
MGVSLAKAEDLQRLAQFARLTFATAFGEDLGEACLAEHFQRNMSDDQFSKMIASDTFYLANDNDDLVGFAQIGPVNSTYQEYLESFDAQASELRRLYVLSTYQGHGIGSELMKHAFQDSLVVATRTIYLTTWEANVGAQALYQRNGFRKVGAIPEYRQDGKLEGYEYILARPAGHGGTT